MLAERRVVKMWQNLWTLCTQNKYKCHPFVNCVSCVIHRRASGMAFRQHINIQGSRLALPRCWHRHLCRCRRTSALRYDRHLLRFDARHLWPRRLRHPTTGCSRVHSGDSSTRQGYPGWRPSTPTQRLCRHVRWTVATNKRDCQCRPKDRQSAADAGSDADSRCALLQLLPQPVQRGCQWPTVVGGRRNPGPSSAAHQVLVVGARRLAGCARTAAGDRRRFAGIGPLVPLHAA